MRFSGIEILSRNNNTNSRRGGEEGDLITGDRVQMIYRDCTHRDAQSGPAEIRELVRVNLKSKAQRSSSSKYSFCLCNVKRVLFTKYVREKTSAVSNKMRSQIPVPRFWQHLAGDDFDISLRIIFEFRRHGVRS